MDKKFMVRDYMSSNPHKILDTTSFGDAVKTMIDMHTNGLVVVNKDNTVVGILSCWDLIQYVVPDYLESDKHLAHFEAECVFSRETKKVASDSITDIMTKKVVTVMDDATIMEAATLLSEHGIRQLPVVDHDHKLIGYINRTNIKEAMADVLDIPRTRK